MLYESYHGIPGFKGVIIEKMEQLEERVILHVSMRKIEHTCPDCVKKTTCSRLSNSKNQTFKVV